MWRYNGVTDKHTIVYDLLVMNSSDLTSQAKGFLDQVICFKVCIMIDTMIMTGGSFHFLKGLIIFFFTKDCKHHEHYFILLTLARWQKKARVISLIAIVQY
jgi:hypothetical protein